MATALTRVILERDPALKSVPPSYDSSWSTNENPYNRETWENLTPMGRIGEPEDLKGALIYLASEASQFTTGTELIVDGGYICVRSSHVPPIGVQLTVANVTDVISLTLENGQCSRRSTFRLADGNKSPA